MGLPPDVVAAIVGMALASYGCRAGGFWVMGFAGLECLAVVSVLHGSALRGASLLQGR